MQRTVITPADLSGGALDEVKSWLGISRSQEDALLTDLLLTSVDLCDAFTGQSPVEQIVEEFIPSTPGAYDLQSRPVKAPISVQSILNDGTRVPLVPDAFEFAIDACNGAQISLKQTGDARAVAVTIRAGIAPDWESIPKPLKQGIIRLAAFHYRDREPGQRETPPTSVAALWRPWRLTRLT